MTPRAVAAPRLVHRLGRRPDAWAWPDWAYSVDGTFGNRYDDPRGVYRVLYASTQRLACFLETLARFRPDPAVFDALDGIKGGEDGPTPGALPARWLEGRSIGSAGLKGAYCDVGHSQTLGWLREELKRDLDASTVRASVPRRLTQEISRRVFELGGFAGVRYLSRLGDELENWAIFEPATLRHAESEPLQSDDEDLKRALDRFGLTLT